MILIHFKNSCVYWIFIMYQVVCQSETIMQYFKVLELEAENLNANLGSVISSFIFLQLNFFLYKHGTYYRSHSGFKDQIWKTVFERGT